jgi:hypothetical protein
MHLSRSELKPFLEANRVVLLQGAIGESRRQEAKRTEKTVVWIIPEAGAATGAPTLPHGINTGLSNKLGEELAKRVRQRQGWALAMYEQIRRRPLPVSLWATNDCARSEGGTQ